FTLEGDDHGGGEIHALEALSAAQAARAEDVDFHKLVADDVETNEEHSVGDQLGPHDLHDPQGPLIHLGLTLFAASMDVAADIVPRSEPAESRDLPFIF